MWKCVCVSCVIVSIVDLLPQFQNIIFLMQAHKDHKKVKGVGKIWNASRICVSSLRRGHANLLCIVPILVYVFRRIHIFGCFSNLYTTIFSPPNCFFPLHEHFFSISIPFHCKTVPSRPPMQDIVTWNLLSKKNVAPFIILSYSNLAVDGRQQYVNEPKIIIKNYSLDYPWWDSNPQSLN